MVGMSPNSARRPNAGDLIAGKYRVLRALGEGGMGTVLVARHELLDVSVAVKVLTADLTRSDNGMGRFLREAQAVARLKSEHVAHVMDIGTTEEGQPFIVMELLDGKDLEERLLGGPLPVPVAVDFVLQAIEAVAQAHAIGIVHRDLKPANLFVAVLPGAREVVKVLDFGVAKLIDGTSRVRKVANDQVLTGEHSAVGSPSYMSPEQVRAESVDARTDIWSLGTILYELLTERTAFSGASTAEIFAAILHTTPEPLRTLCPSAPAELEAAVARCLQRAPADRYQNVAELARAIAPFGSGAYEAYVPRIEQMLASAAKLFDPDVTTMTRLRQLEISDDPAIAALLASAPPPRPSSVARLGSGAPGDEGKRAASTVSEPAPANPRFRRTLVALAIAGTCLGAAAVYLLSQHGKSPAQAEAVTPAATAPPTVSAAAPSEAPSAIPSAPEPAAPLASSTASATAPSIASSGHPASTPSSSRPVPSHRGKPKDTRPGLPGVLRSAD
jgi:serine/threonine-protein kinase